MSSAGARPREESTLFNEGLLRPEEIQEILRAFFDQARSSLEALGQGVLAIEGMVPSQARLRPLRRAAHTLKGDCASVGFAELSRLAHAVEDALAGLERRGQRVSADESDQLLAAVDRLRAGLEAGAAGQAMPGVDDLVELLTRGTRGEGAPDAWEEGLEADHHRRLREGAAQGRHPFLLRVQPRGARQDPRRAARSAARKLQVEVLAEVPVAAGGGRRAVLIGLSASTEDQLREAARALRGVSVEVQRLRVAPAAGQGAAAAGAREGETVRVEARRVDEVLNLVGEMVTARATLAGVAAEAEGHLSEELAARLADAQSLLGHVLQDLQRSAMRMRMVAVDRVFRRFWRVVRDLGRHTGKKLVLAIEGEGTELDRGILDALDEPLLHLVRNAADHGIESPEARRAAGKPEEGRIVLRASREGNQILIEVADDGKGIDPAAVKQAAAAKGFLAEGEAMPDEDALQLVFRPGLSTARQVTETSGRGVGLEVVRETVEALKGSIRASNLPEGGASFLIKVPLTVAIIKALLFRVGGQDLAVPLTAVVEIARAATLRRERIGTHEVFRLRDAALGLVRLGPLLGLPDVPEGSGFVVVLQASSGSFGVLVEELMGEQELVIKAVHDRWIRTPLVAGASVLGRGALALILDVLSVHRAALGRGGSTHV